MGLLDNLYKENYKYIRALDALNMLAKDERCDVSKIAEFLLAYEYHKCSETYKKNYINQIEPCDDKAVGIVPVDYWAVTKDILDKALVNFTYSGNTFSEMYEESDYALYFWLKEDFYNFDGFKKVNFVINDDTYERYLTYKKLDEYENKANIEQKNKPAELHYTFYLFKKPLLTFHEAACIITGYDPQYVEQCQNDTNFKQNFSNYLGAKDYIDTCTDAQILSYNSMDNRIDSESFKHFLANDGTFIDGFNDHLRNIKTDENYNNQHSIIDQLKEENEKLNNEILILKEQLNGLENPKLQSQQDENAMDYSEINILNSDLLLISALLYTLQNEIKVRGNKSQSKILQKIEDEHVGIKGLSKSRTEKIIAEANKIYKPLIKQKMK